VIEVRHDARDQRQTIYRASAVTVLQFLPGTGFEMFTLRPAAVS